MTPKKPNKLSDLQIRLLDFIQKYRRQHHYAPSYREIKRALGISSISVVHYHVERLVELGRLARDHRISRSLRVVKPVVEPIQESAFAIQRKVQNIWSISVVGSIVASQPVPVPASDFNYYDAEDTVELAPSMLPVRGIDPNSIYALRVKGDSMIEDLVNDGDIIILQRTQEARSGDMVAVWLPDEEETTLKRFYRESDHIRLQPANPTMQPIRIPKSRPLEIQGKVLLTISTK